MYTAYLSIQKIRNIPIKDRWLGDLGLYSMVVSIVFWVSEQAFCSPFIRMLKFHSIWHLGTGFAAYTAVTAMWYYRAKFILQYQCEISLSCWFIPYVRIFDKKTQ